jgi:ribosomal protein S18 acetylase RimI-like enzyme
VGDEPSSGPGPIIERPGPQDADAIGALFEEDMSRLGVRTSLEEQQRFAAQIIEQQQWDQPMCVCWIARLPDIADGAPLGVILANYNWSTKFAGAGLWIDELFVRPEARRRGVGRALVDAVLDFAEERDIIGVDIEAYRGNTPASILYRSMGFHRLARERFYFRFDEDEP